MTMQVTDDLLYEGERYVILQGPAKLGFDPADYAMWPIGLSTANRRGYWCEYAVTDGRLTLEKLSINNRIDYYPLINGIAPVLLEEAEAEVPDADERETADGKRRLSNKYHFYENIGLALGYSGRIVVGCNQQTCLYRGYLFPPAWVFGTVLELTFENGLLVDTADISGQFTEERARRIERGLRRFDES